MALQANPYPLRIDPMLMEKLKIIANENGRSVNKEIEFSIKRTIKDYETLNGNIQLDTLSK